MRSSFRTVLAAFVAALALGAVASASASGFNLEWEACEAQTSGKFENHLCGVQGGAGGWEWKKLGKTQSISIESEEMPAASPFVIVWSGLELTCTETTNTGTLTGGSHGTDETTVTFTGCTTKTAGCKVHSKGAVAGEVVVKNIKTKLVERKTSGGVTVLADAFEGGGTGKEFVWLQYEPEASCKPAKYIETRMVGAVAAECKNNTTTGQIEAVFPNPELQGNSLKAFGSSVKVTGAFTTKRENGSGIRCV